MNGVLEKDPLRSDLDEVGARGISTFMDFLSASPMPCICDHIAPGAESRLGAIQEFPARGPSLHQGLVRWSLYHAIYFPESRCRHFWYILWACGGFDSSPVLAGLVCHVPLSPHCLGSKLVISASFMWFCKFQESCSPSLVVQWSAGNLRMGELPPEAALRNFRRNRSPLALGNGGAGH